MGNVELQPRMGKLKKKERLKPKHPKHGDQQKLRKGSTCPIAPSPLSNPVLPARERVLMNIGLPCVCVRACVSVQILSSRPSAKDGTPKMLSLS